MNQAKRHHFVPKAYLKAFCNSEGKILVYRKDSPSNPLSLNPEAAQFRRYYYSQPTPDGGQDNNALESLFSTVEKDWPITVARLYSGEGVNESLENIFQFMALQRARVPAARDMVEAVLAHVIMNQLTAMEVAGSLPPRPPGLESLVDQVGVSIDPHMSIHAMAELMRGVGDLYSVLGFASIHNHTERQFLTSDNPVIWFNPSLEFSKQLPYAVDLTDGPIFFYFPVSPTLAIIGSTEYKDHFCKHGLMRSEVPGVAWVDIMNAQICRFAYESIIAKSPGQEEVILEYASVSPVHEARQFIVEGRVGTSHRQVFGPRVLKPKWIPK